MTDQPSPIASRKPRRWLRRLLIVFAIAMAFPLMIIAALSITFSVNAVRPDQLQPRTELLTVKPDMVRDSSKTLDQIISATSKKETAAILRALTDKYSDYKNWYPKSNGDAPLTPEQLAWLTSNREFIDNLFRLAAVGVPTTTYIQAAALNDESLDRLKSAILPQYMYFTRYAQILAAESRRRREAGDLAGAADALIAVYRLSNSTARPFEGGRGMAVYMQSQANEALTHWLATAAMPGDIAARIREQLIKSPITLADARRSIELEYRLERVAYCELLGRNYADLMFRTLQQNAIMRHRPNQSVPLYYHASNPDRVFSNFLHEPVRTAMDVFSAMQTTTHMKATASQNIDRFDSFYRSVLNDIDRNQPMTHPKIAPEMTPTMAPEIVYRLISDNLARIRSLTMALNTIANGSPGSLPDPYSNEAIKVVHTNDATIFYSVGPDRTDDHGLLSYDPTNGTLRPTPGDIVVRIPKPSE